MRKSFKFLFPLFMIFLTLSCAPGPYYTQHEIVQFSTRMYNASTTRVYAALRNVLSDEGVQIVEIDKEKGLIRGKKEIRTTSNFSEFFIGKGSTNIRYYDYVITPIKNGSRITLNIYATSDKTKTKEEAKRVLEATTYNAWFRAIEEELFN